jgi:hypothetical protein
MSQSLGRVGIRDLLRDIAVLLSIIEPSIFATFRL